MSSPEDLLRSALAAHNAGRLTEAEVGYHRVLRKRPADHRALYGLGLLSFHSGARDRGIQYVMRSLESAPGNGRGWVTLGSMYVETGAATEAKAAYRRATEVSPDLSDGWYNVGICLKREGDLDAAAQQLRRAIACATPCSQAYEALSTLYYEQGRLHEAAQIASEWVRREPTHPTAVHMAAAASKGAAPPRASDAYVRRLFDSFAEGFDRNLEGLAYRAPELVVTALQSASAPIAHATSAPGSGTPRFAAVLDAGCGTGLCGPLVRALCRTLVGVDLSPKMLAQAKRRGCYDELVTEELGAFMRSRPGAFDAIVSADTLVYFGDLAEPLAAAQQTLREGGTLVFTVESLPKAQEADHPLQASGRYSHSEAYLRRVLGATGFGVHSMTRQTLREERGAGVQGYLVVARRS